MVFYGCEIHQDDEETVTVIDRTLLKYVDRVLIVDAMVLKHEKMVPTGFKMVLMVKTCFR